MIAASLFISKDISSVVLELFGKARRKQFQRGGGGASFSVFRKSNCTLLEFCSDATMQNSTPNIAFESNVLSN